MAGEFDFSQVFFYGIIALIYKDIYRGENKMDIKTGDILTMKKPHPCGCSEFSVERVGMDFKLKCLKCGHTVMIPRQKAEKNIKKIGGEVR